MHHTQSLGHQGEELVAQRLIADGYAIIARNYRKLYGEIDLIALRNDELIFVEVKLRINPLFDPTYSITPAKQRRIGMVAKEFIAAGKHEEKVFRFDVAIVTQSDENTSIMYLANAFEVEES